MKYTILSESLHIMLSSGKSISLSKSDPLFNSIRGDLLKKRYDRVEETLSASKDNSLNLEYRDGSYFFKDIQIPTFLSNYISKNKELGKSLLNFWLNMVKKHDEEIVYNICQELISRNFFPLTKDGFIIGYDEKDMNYSKNSYLKNTDSREVLFYNIQSLPSALYEQIKGMFFEDSIKTLFNSSSKKLLKILRDNCFNREENHIRFDYLILSYVFKDILLEENLIKYMESAKGNDLDVGKAHLFNSFLKEISLEKDNVSYNQKKILNFIETVNWDTLNSFLHLYDVFKNNVNISMVDLELKNNYDDYLSHFTKECAKFHNTKVFSLLVEQNFPQFMSLKEEEFGNYIIILPQTNIDLIEWTNKMGNCIHSFADRVASGSTMVLALVDKGTNQMIFNIEIHRGVIKQMERVRKTSYDPKIKKDFTQFLFQKGLIYQN